MTENRALKMKLKDIYPLYTAKAERKGRTAQEVDQIICWLTGYSMDELQLQIATDVDMEGFFKAAPAPNPNRCLITGSVCGVKISEISDPLIKEIRYLDKLVDELAKGKSMDKILRNA